MLIPIYNKPFKKDIKLMERRHMNMAGINEIMTLLIEEEPLPERCREHELSGNFKGYTGGPIGPSHIQGDWVLIYKFGEGVIRFARTGSNSDLF
jgi:mRNA interferase YafQ